MLTETRLKAFLPIVSPNVKVLILGSMPSTLSLADNQYYANPRNHFWQIISVLFGIDTKLRYINRCLSLSNYHVALWDVIARCKRRGSLDSDIVDESG